MKPRLILPSAAALVLVIVALAMGIIYVAQVVFFSVAILFFAVLWKALRTGFRNRHSPGGLGGTDQ